MPTARTKSKALPRADFPEQVGVSSKAISELLDDFERSGIELHSIMILRHGKVAFETWRDPYAPDIPHTMYSVSKSFASIATGFAIDEGLLTLDTKVIDIFPEYRPQKYDANLEKMTVFHLLTMTAGKDVSVLENKAKVSWLKSFFGARWAFAPGEGWKYISENCYVLCAIIQKLTGMTVREYLAPLRDRFLITNHMQFYEPQELKKIITRAAHILQIEIEDSGAEEIARRSRGTPRIANRLLKRIRDFAQVKESAITADIAAEALAALHVDEIGLDDLDNQILKAIIHKFNGGPVGIDTISAAVSEERATIEDVCEPYLMQIGFLSRTPRGRLATEAAYEHIGAAFPAKGEK